MKVLEGGIDQKVGMERERMFYLHVVGGLVGTGGLS